MLLDIEKLVEFYGRNAVDAWNQRHPDYPHPLVWEECDKDPEDQACEMMAMSRLVNHILDDVITNMKLKAPNTVGALRFQEEFVKVVEEMRPK